MPKILNKAGNDLRYLIDSANMNEIEDALGMGVSGVTANPSMYLKNKVSLHGFIGQLETYKNMLLTAEVIGDTAEEMLRQAETLVAMRPDIIIKINFSREGMRLIKMLKERNIRSAATLIFNLNQATLAMEAGADFLFVFIGRNDENGHDGISVLDEICSTIRLNDYNTSVVAASIKNVYHLQQAALSGAHYAAITFDTMKKAIYSELTVNGAYGFEQDWKML